MHLLHTILCACKSLTSQRLVPQKFLASIREAMESKLTALHSLSHGLNACVIQIVTMIENGSSVQMCAQNDSSQHRICTTCGIRLLSDVHQYGVDKKT